MDMRVEKVADKERDWLREEEGGGNEDLIGSCCLNSKRAEQGSAVSA